MPTWSIFHLWFITFSDTKFLEGWNKNSVCLFVCFKPFYNPLFFFENYIFALRYSCVNSVESNTWGPICKKQLTCNVWIPLQHPYPYLLFDVYCKSPVYHKPIHIQYTKVDQYQVDWACSVFLCKAKQMQSLTASLQRFQNLFCLIVQVMRRSQSALAAHTVSYTISAAM